MSGQSQRSIAYLCLETPREGQAAHTHVHEIIKGLRSRGWTIDLVTTGAGGAAGGGALWRRALDYVLAQGRLVQRLSQFDAVYMRTHPAALPASLLCALLGKPVIQEINGRPDDLVITYPWLRWLGWPLKACYRWQMKWAAQVITVTEGLRLWAGAESGHSRVSLVPNGANTDLFRPDGDKPADLGIYVAFVGGLVAWHGVATMLSAIDRQEWPEGVRLVVIGDGVERERLRAAKDHPRLVWLGRKPYAEVPTYLRGAIGALCVIEDPDGRSSTGVAPLKLFEAMACGTAVIVTDLPFQADVVRNEQAGIVIPVADPGALAKAVARLRDGPEDARQMGLRGSGYVRHHASWQVRAEETGVIIERALQPVRIA
ncbi:MAG: glycosyltransferase family 4 protein [Rhizobiales bacterium]|nr:glycosyltransferase family 4 protein [Hyphomicrobiales bacterium]